MAASTPTNSAEQPAAVLDLLAGILASPAEETLSGAVRGALADQDSANPQIDQVLDDAGATYQTLSGLPELDHQAREALEAAAAHRPPGRSLELRDLAAALLLRLDPGIPPPAQASLRESGIILGDFGSAFLDYINEQHEEEAEHWRDVVRRGGLDPYDRAEGQNDMVPEIVTPDQDLLGIKHQTLRFAKLLAAREVQPPVALGLFGNWGTGKTFFMRLIKNQIETLTESGDPGVVGRVAQIEFNAWHYADANLWASLAMRIFEGLAEALGQGTEDTVAETRRKLHSQIESNRRRASEAGAQLRKAHEGRRLATKRLNKLQRQRAEAVKDRQAAQLVSAFRKTFNSKDFASEKAAIQSAAKRLGLKDAIGSVQELQNVERQLRDLTDRTTTLAAIVANRFTGRQAFLSIGIVLLSLAALMALGEGLEALSAGDSSKIPATLVQLGAAFSAVLAWAGRNLGSVTGALGKLELLNSNMEDAITSGPPGKEELDAQQRIERLDAFIRVREEQVASAEQQQAEAVEELQRIDEGGLVYDFLDDRRRSSLYLDELGLVSTIRSDLEELKKRLEDFRKHGANAPERIILYIDDLDRCKANQVVEVLQAVHLLLALDLFNVVVGVDARWLERSLQREYVDNGSAARERNSGYREVFSAQNYLEKIFQIPYSLSEMSKAGFNDLVNGMITTRSEREEQAILDLGEGEEPDLQSVNRDTENMLDPEGEDTNAQEADDQQNNDLTGGERVGDEDNAAGQDVDSDTNSEPGDAEKDTAVVAAPPIRLDAELYLEDWEEAFITNLYPFVGTPRLLKRLINIYRLLRVEANDGDFVRFVGDANSGDHRAVLVLLAVNVGMAEAGNQLLPALEACPDSETWESFLAALQAASIQKDHWAWDVRMQWPADPTVGTGPLPYPPPKLKEALAHLRALTGMPPDIASYKYWSPRAGRYSFHWHLDSGAIPET